jgi:hypothetical protein
MTQRYHKAIDRYLNHRKRFIQKIEEETGAVDGSVVLVEGKAELILDRRITINGSLAILAFDTLQGSKVRCGILYEEVSGIFHIELTFINARNLIFFIRDWEDSDNPWFDAQWS